MNNKPKHKHEPPWPDLVCQLVGLVHKEINLLAAVQHFLCTHTHTEGKRGGGGEAKGKERNKNKAEEEQQKCW